VAFEVAIFTDVSATESVTGYDGFQFQSVSPGFDGEHQSVVQSELNFIPVSTWGSAHGGDDRSHPEQYSFAVRDDQLYLTKSHSLGLTANGRPGNQLTEVATTSSSDDLVPYTPAQLMTASTWTQTKSPSKFREPWMTPLQINPAFEADELERFVRSDPWVLSVLPSFVTMLRRSLTEDGHRVFIQHTDLTEVLRWIALGSALLDSDSARQLTFRAFHANPWNGPFKVVGIHPELMALTSVAEWRNSPSASWIDLGTRTISETVPSALAAASVRWLTDHGIYETMGATQLAAEFQSTLGPDLAVRVADLMTFGQNALSARDAWDIANKALTALASSGQHELLESNADELLDSLVTYRPNGAAEFTQAANTVAGLLDAGLPDVATGVLVPALEALAVVPQFTAAFAGPIANAPRTLRWADPDARHMAAKAWATALGGAPDSELSRLFGATNALGLDLDPGLLIPAVDRLSDQWAADPSMFAQSQTWYARDTVQNALEEKVGAALTRGDNGQMRALLRGDWSTLTTTANSPLSAWLRVRELTTHGPAQRTEQLRALPSRSIPSSSWQVVVGELRLPPDVGLIRSFVAVAGLPDDLALSLESLARQEMRAPELTLAADRPTRWSDIFDLLDVQKVGVSPLPRLTSFIVNVESARISFGRARTERDSSRSAALRGSANYARLWAMEDLVGTGGLLVQAEDRRGAGVLADHLGGVTRQALNAFLDTVATGRDSVDGGRVAITAYTNSDGTLRDELGFAISRLVEQHKDIERGLKKDESLVPLIIEIKQTFPAEPSKSWRNPSSWFGRGDKA
jgi:hypothetical protein